MDVTLPPTCDAIKQNGSEVEHSTFLVFYIAVLTIFNAMFSEKPHEKWFVHCALIVNFTIPNTHATPQ